MRGSACPYSAFLALGLKYQTSLEVTASVSLQTNATKDHTDFTS